MIYEGDNLEVMRGMGSESVDLVYLDPPFNTGRDWGEFDDRWKINEFEDDWHSRQLNSNVGLYYALEVPRLIAGEGMKSYLVMLGIRLMEMRRLLKPTGSIYVHVDSRVSGYLRVVLDAIFGIKNFRREIVWKMPRPSGFKTQARNWIRDHDVLLYYRMPMGQTFNKQYEPYDSSYVKKFNRTDEDGKYWLRNGKKRRLGKGYALGSNWTDIHSMQTQSVSRREGVSYPTQKPVALLERIIKASSNEGDVVLDPFCGSGTTLVAAKRLGRRWIGIDMNVRAVELSRGRIKDVGGVTEYQKNLVDVSN